LAYLRKHGTPADVLHLHRIGLRSSTDGYSIAKALRRLFVCFIPILNCTRYTFAGETYSIFTISYGRLSGLLMPFLLRHVARRGPYSIIHYHFLWNTRVFRLLDRVLRRPSVISVRGSDLHRDAVHNLPARAFYKTAIAHARRVIYVSKGLRDIAESIGLTTEKDTVIGNGFDPNVFKRTENESAQICLGFVGSLRKTKGVDRLPRIFAKVKHAIPDTKLLLVGRTDFEEGTADAMRQEFREYGIESDVTFAGGVLPGEMPSYYARMHILLLPSRNEGFPNSVLEARASGVPVVGSSNGGIPEAIGTGGIVVPEGEDFEQSFAHAVVNLARGLPSRESIHEGAKHLTWDHVVEQIIDVYRTVLDGTRSLKGTVAE
jgi:teichuronic acid biosynthesis glycosyltransferase TuaC